MYVPFYSFFFLPEAIAGRWPAIEILRDLSGITEKENFDGVFVPPPLS